MSGGPTLTSPQKTPTPTRGAAKRSGPGMSPGRAAIKDSLRGKDFDTQSAMLRPDQQGPGSKAGRGGASAKGSGGAARDGASTKAGASGTVEVSVGGHVGEAKTDSGPEVRDTKTLPFFAGRGGDSNGIQEESTKDDSKSGSGSQNPTEEPETLETTARKIPKSAVEMDTLAKSVHEMGGPRFIVNGSLVVPMDEGYKSMSHADFEVFAADILKGNDRSAESTLQKQINDFCFETLIAYFPTWIMKNCYIFEESRLQELYTHSPERLLSTINEIKHGVRAPVGNWAAMGEGGKKAKENFEPMETAFQILMFINAGCIVAFGAAVGATFEIGRGLFALAWSGSPRGQNGLKDALAEAWAPPPLTLKTLGPLQHQVIKDYYFNDNTLVHRFFNEMDPGVPHPMREKLGAAMRAIS